MCYRTAALLAAVLLTMILTAGCKQQPKEVGVVPPPPPGTSGSGIYAVDAGSPMDAAPAPTFDDAAAGAGATYTVAKGDTLWSIAKKTYGDGNRWKEIADANGITDAKKLRVGQELVLP